MQSHQREFIEFALRHDVLRFGSFTLKSGRTSPYFFNAGAVDTGASLSGLGHFYAEIVAPLEFDMLFGPAYKGIPLVSATAVQLAETHGRDVPWCFNRKEVKTHGEGGLVVGAPLAGRVLLLDDVITAGTAIGEAADIIVAAGAQLAGVVVAIDRQERGAGALSAVRQVEQDLGAPVRAIVTLDDIVEYLAETGRYSEHLAAMTSYRDEYGDNGA